MLTHSMQQPADRFLEEQLFEEDVRAVVRLLRPHARERLEGWHEYRTGGAEFRACISWNPDARREGDDEGLVVPRMADVLEAILVGSTKSPDELTAEQEFGIYRRVIRELYQRLNELESRYH
ncbi:MAG TPA: hypothetical protein VLJ39_13865 [Tepidisphaeraceae bacterium]|jgi:hypothetical protein|nr:hypothetical protein [Tepidisphaeraceae bacterium]